MIFIKEHTFEVIVTPRKMLKLRKIGKMGPYAHGRFSPAIFEAYREIVLDTLHFITKKIYNEEYYVEPKTIECLQSLAKAYKFKSLMAWFDRYWQKRDEESFASNLRLEVKNRPNAEYETNKQIEAFKEEMELSEEWPELNKARIKYLETQKANLSSYLDKMNAHILSMIDKDTETLLIDCYKSLNNYNYYDGKIKSTGIIIAHLKGEYKSKKTIVTDEMINVAKKVPFDKLLKLEPFGRMKRCKCPFHNEKTASFYVYPDTNRGHCHGCGKNVDTIQYLVEIKKMKFNQAVLALLDY